MIQLVRDHDFLLIAIACSPKPFVALAAANQLGLDPAEFAGWWSARGPGSICFFRVVGDEPMDVIVILNTTADQLPMYDTEIAGFGFHSTVLTLEDVYQVREAI